VKTILRTRKTVLRMRMTIFPTLELFQQFFAGGETSPQIGFAGRKRGFGCLLLRIFVERRQFVIKFIFSTISF